jgi:hypothetical protein
MVSIQSEVSQSMESDWRWRAGTNITDMEGVEVQNAGWIKGKVILEYYVEDQFL